MEKPRRWTFPLIEDYRIFSEGQAMPRSCQENRSQKWNNYYALSGAGRFHLVGGASAQSS